MSHRKWLSLLVCVGAACSAEATNPAATVRVDARVTPSLARVGEEITITLVATNPGPREAQWSSGCGMNLAFELHDAGDQVVEAPAYGVCTTELRRLSLAPGVTLTESVRWRLGHAPGPAGPLGAGYVQVVGRLGFGDRVPRPGQRAVLDVRP